MSLYDKLIALLMDEGADADTAEEIAAHVCPQALPRILVDRRRKAIRDLFPVLGAAGVCERFGIHRATAYRALKKVAQKRKTRDKQRVGQMQ